MQNQFKYFLHVIVLNQAPEDLAAVNVEEPLDDPFILAWKSFFVCKSINFSKVSMSIIKLLDTNIMFVFISIHVVQKVVF
jgi:hypothetical protein